MGLISDSRCAFIVSFTHGSNEEPANQNQVLEFTVLEYFFYHNPGIRILGMSLQTFLNRA